MRLISFSQRAACLFAVSGYVHGFVSAVLAEMRIDFIAMWLKETSGISYLAAAISGVIFLGAHILDEGKKA